MTKSYSYIETPGESAHDAVLIMIHPNRFLCTGSEGQAGDGVGEYNREDAIYIFGRAIVEELIYGSARTESVHPNQVGVPPEGAGPV
jgi:hypothetical protein